MANTSHLSLREDSLFLLHHPRRCYLYLFPARDTWYLVVIQLSIDFSGWVGLNSKSDHSTIFSRSMLHVFAASMEP